MNLKSVHRAALTELVEAGSGTLDTAGRVCVGPIKRPVSADAIVWLVLVAQGLVAGERGFVIPTEEGRAAVAQFANGRVREAS